MHVRGQHAGPEASMGIGPSCLSSKAKKPIVLRPDYLYTYRPNPNQMVPFPYNQKDQESDKNKGLRKNFSKKKN